MHVKELQLLTTKTVLLSEKIYWFEVVLSVNEIVTCKFSENPSSMIGIALGNTPEAPSQTAPVTTVNLKGSEALDSPVGGVKINTTLHVFAQHKPAGKTQV